MTIRLSILLLLMTVTTSYADITIPMYSVVNNQIATTIGSLTLADSMNGVIINPNLQHLLSGIHGFRLVKGNDCNTVIAKNHYLTQPTGNNDANSNDFLSPLFVNDNGTATMSSIAPNKTLNDFNNHILIIYNDIHQYPDQNFPNYSGTISACGVITVPSS